MQTALGIVVGAPLLAGLLMLAVRSWAVRTPLVILAALITAGAAATILVGGPAECMLGPAWTAAGTWAEAAVILAVLVIGWRIRCWPVVLAAIAQLGLAAGATFLAHARGAEAHAAGMRVVADPLALLMLLIVSGIGPVIVVHALGYMRAHEHHAPPTASSTGRFFAVLVAFLGLMNGLVLVDNLAWLGFFWEATTLCSFFLIGHDGTPEAMRSARRALLMNTFGGLALSVGAYLTALSGGEETLAHLCTGAALVPVCFLVLAAMIKSAQMPFQRWLLGAMVAPSPVSALLHSSTMVKAGSYLVLRLAPALTGTRVAMIVALAGGFTFAACSALAVGQANGKKILAYSTIANLGLIVACAGINTPLSIAAGLMILCFHALSKALLFLCVGAIEQRIGSRHVEDMSGLLFRMPFVTVITILGMVSMIAPPFGMILGKWMVIESAVQAPLLLVLIILGSALTIFFWAKWLGRITTASFHPTYTVEPLRATVGYTLAALSTAVVVLSLSSMLFFRYIIKPVSLQMLRGAAAPAVQWTLLESIDSFRLWPIFLVLGLAAVALLVTLLKFSPRQVREPFLCGENLADEKSSCSFRSLLDGRETALVTSYYLPSIFGESRLTAGCNLVAILILAALFGVLVNL